MHPHRFNGGYDAASPLTWTPQQAAEFTIFHDGTPQHAGMQLKSTIQHWHGDDLAQFLTRLYLGQLEDDTTTNEGEGHRSGKKVVYEPKNVRNPRWKGLETREGILALKDLLKESLSKEALSAQEIARFAESFLLKDYRWPLPMPKANATSANETLAEIISKPRKIEFENDSFYSLGHSRTIARILLAIRRERGYDEFNWNDIALMVTLPEKRDEDREETPMQMIDFFRTITAYTSLTAADKAMIVQRMAMSGWLSKSIPNFMAKLLPEETLTENHSVDEIWRLQGDAFLDFPSEAAVLEMEAKQAKNETSAVEMAVAKVAKVIVEKRKTLSLEKPSIKTTIPTAAAAAPLPPPVAIDASNATSGNTTATANTTTSTATATEKASTNEEKKTVESEFDDLVQSYWKKVDFTAAPNNKNPLEAAYGVPKTKSVKKRKIPARK